MQPYTIQTNQYILNKAPKKDSSTLLPFFSKGGKKLLPDFY
jgi:hypothetical protein